ncbi:MAG: chalcone isomerase family protein [Deltaproteobacteria bacterium]|nr:chalcone isomerase family protein [Deltaproteobacteria bacterium]
MIQNFIGISKFLLAAALGSLMLSAAPAQATEIEGYNFPNDTQAAGQPVKLVGVGVRTKWMMNIYVMGAYMATPKKSASALINNDEPKMMWLHMMRGIGADKMREAIDTGLEKNVAAAERARIAPDVDKIKAAFPSDISKNLDMQFIYTPAGGFALKIGSAVKFSSPDKGLAKAMFSMWFGPSPNDKDLKKQVLGE